MSIHSSVIACSLLRQANTLTDAQRDLLYETLEEVAAWLNCPYSVALRICLIINRGKA